LRSLPCPCHPSRTLLPYTTLSRSHQPLGDELCSAKTVGKFPDLARVLLRHLLVDAHACHSFPYLRRGIRHQTDDLHGSCAGFLKDRKSTRLNSSHVSISYAVFCLK